MERSCEILLSAEKEVHAYLVQCAIIHSTGSPLQQTKTLKHFCVAGVNGGRSMLAMFPTVLYMVESLETETLK